MLLSCRVGRRRGRALANGQVRVGACSLVEGSNPGRRLKVVEDDEDDENDDDDDGDDAHQDADVEDDGFDVVGVADVDVDVDARRRPRLGRFGGVHQVNLPPVQRLSRPKKTNRNF